MNLIAGASATCSAASLASFSIYGTNMSLGQDTPSGLEGLLDLHAAGLVDHWAGVGYKAEYVWNNN